MLSFLINVRQKMAILHQNFRENFYRKILWFLQNAGRRKGILPHCYLSQNYS
jgi:hypothetical protein